MLESVSEVHLVVEQLRDVTGRGVFEVEIVPLHALAAPIATIGSGEAERG